MAEPKPPKRKQTDTANRPGPGRPKKAKTDQIEEDQESPAIFLPKRAHLMGDSSQTARDYVTLLRTKHDADSRPIWVCPDGHIFLETFSPIYRQAYDFLIAISEPESRATLIHEYQLTSYSLYAAVSVGLTTEDIISVLNRLSKVELPEKVEEFIRDCTLSYGKVKLVLQHNRYFLESSSPEVLQTLLKDKVIGEARIKTGESSDLILSQAPTGGFQISGGIQSRGVIDPVLQSDSLQEKLLEEDEEEEEDAITSKVSVHSFEIQPRKVEPVKKRCTEMEFPLLEEYDFRNDTINPDLPIDLKPSTIHRPYQEKSLSKMFGNGRARSGIIVLPCGAGKTLVGITAASTIKKSCLVLCTGSVSVEQWREQFLMWTTLDPKSIARFTSDKKERFETPAGVTISTYNMIAHTKTRAETSQKMMDELEKREWGLVLLDEVHVVPAQMFRKVLTVTKSHCKLGLTATLVREDDRIDDLRFLIGPKLYEANWMDLARAGYIANVQCVEIWCPMDPLFFQEYLNADSRNRRTLLYVSNPEKFRTCEYLIKVHEERKDKIIVFSDNIFALEYYAKKMGKLYIYGGTGNTERMRVLQQFRHNPAVNTIFISKVGDNSIDLPDANVLIQISSHYGARRQEAQRLGRILRAKKTRVKTKDEYNAFFYTLVSKDTEEMYYSTKRQQFLIDQGYAFKTVTNLPIQEDTTLQFGTQKERTAFLAEVLARDEAEGQEEDYTADTCSLVITGPPAKRSKQSARALSGGADMTYAELRQKNPIFNRMAVPRSIFQQQQQNK